MKPLHHFPIVSTTEEDFKDSNPGIYRDIWTEIVIQVPPSKVRDVFLDFENRPSWDPFYRKFVVKNGQVDDTSTEPAIGFTVNEKCDGKKDFRVPFTFPITKNDEDGIIWSYKLVGGYLFLLDHVHLFQPLDGGKATRLVNYERQAGLIKYFTNIKSFTRAFKICNEALKKACEDGEAEK